MFAVSRVYLQWKNATLNAASFIFWAALFVLAMVGVVNPMMTSEVAKFLGIGRGVDAVLYLSIILLFYLLFRIYIYVENIRHEITDIISQLALKEDKKLITKKK
jgi:hypothetical protein